MLTLVHYRRTTLSEERLIEISGIVGNLVDGLEVGFEAFAEHDSSSPEHRRALARLSRAFAALWEQESSLRLDVATGGFARLGEPVVAASSGRSALAKALYGGGIRALVFFPGAEGSEVVRLLTNISDGGGGPADAGLRTLIWGLDLDHIRYAVAEETEGTEPELKATRPRGPEESAERKALIRDEASTTRPSGIVDVEDFDSTLYFLDQREIDYLKDEIDREYAQDLGRSIVTLLLDILDMQADPDVRGEVTGVLERLLPQLLADGEFASATYLLTETEARMSGVDVSAADRKALGRMTAELSRPGALAQLLQFLEEGHALPSSDELGSFFGLLRPEALEIILKWMLNLTNTDTSALLGEAVEQMAREHPDALRAALTSKDSVAVSRALDLVQRIRPTDVVDELCAVASHPDSGVRSSAAQVLGVIGGARCCGQLTRMLDDPESSIRVNALGALATRRYPRALDRVDEILRSDELLTRDLSEQRALFVAFGSLAGPAGISYLEPLLIGKKGVGRRSPEVRACAAVALGRIGTTAARMALQLAKKDKNPVVRVAAGRALRAEGRTE